MANAKQTFWMDKVDNLAPAVVWTEANGVVTGTVAHFSGTIAADGLLTPCGLNASVFTTYLLGHLHD